ncbi:DUF5709 domain-containing protein [Streptomyces sp. NPDC008163]|uniref:DUF5709 domain-containing protein n=1 Tax=Streptomyces sp. NPDC008163 TaxID=3364818 RepID=UPI0036EB4CB6
MLRRSRPRAYRSSAAALAAAGFPCETGRRTDVYAEDVGLDGSAASADEHTVHTGDEENDQGREDGPR